MESLLLLRILLIMAELKNHIGHMRNGFKSTEKKNYFLGLSLIRSSFSGCPVSLINEPYIQLMYVNFIAAQIFCEAERVVARKSHISTDDHSPARFRVNGAFSNQIEFSKDFHCSSTARMNPRLKCSVW